MLFAQRLHLFTFPATGHEGPSSAGSPAPAAFCRFDGGHSNAGEVVPPCGFDLRSGIIDGECLFMLVGKSAPSQWHLVT